MTPESTSHKSIPDESSVSKQKAIARILSKDILSGKYPALGQFPSERALMKRFSVARQTIHQAVQTLRNKGLIFIRRGQGSFVAGRDGGRPLVKIGLIISGGCHTEIFKVIAEEMDRLARKSKVELVFEDYSFRNAVEGGRRTLEAVRKMIKARVAGLVLQPVEYSAEAERLNREIMREIERAKLPLVLLDTDLVQYPKRSGYDIVGIDNISAGRQLTQHVRDQGAWSIRFLVNSCYANSVRMRFEAFQLETNDHSPSALVDVDPTATAKIERLLKENPTINAFICQNDIAAVNLMATLKRLRKRVPEDILVAGFDDGKFSRGVKPTLTTVHQPCAEIARTAFDRIRQRIATPDMPACDLLLSSPLVIRESTLRQRDDA